MVLIHRFFIHTAAISIREDIVIVCQHIETAISIVVEQLAQILATDDISLLVVFGLVKLNDALVQIDVLFLYTEGLVDTRAAAV